MRKLLLLVMIMFCFNLFSANYYVTEAGAGAKNGTSWANAWGYAELHTFVTAGSATLGDRIYIAGGTYTLTANLAYNRDSKLTMIGVKSTTTAMPPTVSDFAYGDDRPLFACGSYYVDISNYSNNHFLNLRFTSAVNGTTVQSGYTFNVKSVNTYNATTVNALRLEGYWASSFCEVSAPYGRGVRMEAYTSICNFTVYDCAIIGIVSASNAHTITISNSIVYDCGIGIFAYEYGNINHQIYNNTIYNCTTGIDFNNCHGIVNNNLIVNCTTGLLDASSFNCTVKGNNYYGNTNRTSGTITNELTYSTLDPNFVDAANGDFTPQNTALVGQAYPATFQGTDTDNKSIAGAVQLDGSATGGSDQSHFSVY